MPIIDLPELIDDLWFGRPNWYLPYVEASAEACLLGQGSESDLHTSELLYGEVADVLPQQGSKLGGFSLPGWWSQPFRRSDSQSTSNNGELSPAVEADSHANGTTALVEGDHVPIPVDQVGTTSSSHPAEEAVVGTWAERQTNFNLVAASRASPPGDSDPKKTTDEADADKKILDKAWEWRFRQRWAKEHTVDPYAKEVQEDDGLAFMQQHGAYGWHQQFGMNDSSERVAPLRPERSASQDLMFGLLQTPTPTPDQCSHLLRRASRDVHPANGEATQQILQAARQAHELLAKQAQIEADVQKRWDACKSDGAPWAGKDLPSTACDMWGAMQYFLLKLEDEGKHKFIVRAKHSLCNEDAVRRSVQKEIAELSRRGGVPSSPSLVLCVLGEGVLEWKDDASVRIIPHSGNAEWSALDAGGLAASLFCQTLPVQLEMPGSKSTVN